MSAMATNRRQSVEPKAGPLFQRAKGLDVGGAKRRRPLLALLAGFADVGEHSPSMNSLVAQLKRAGVPPRDRNPRVIDALLDRLVEDGFLEVEWAGDGRAEPGNRQGESGERNRYVLGAWAQDVTTQRVAQGRPERSLRR